MSKYCLITWPGCYIGLSPHAFFYLSIPVTIYSILPYQNYNVRLLPAGFSMNSSTLRSIALLTKMESWDSEKGDRKSPLIQKENGILLYNNPKHIRTIKCVWWWWKYINVVVQTSLVETRHVCFCLFSPFWTSTAEHTQNTDHFSLNPT